MVKVKRKSLDLVGRVHAGRLSPPSTHSVQQYIFSIGEGDVEINIKPYREKRSNQQNRYLYGVVYKMAQEAYEESFGEAYSLDEVKRDLKIACDHYKIRRTVGGELTKEPLPTPNMNTQEFSDLVNRMRRILFERMGCDIPNPDGILYSIEMR